MSLVRLTGLSIGACLSGLVLLLLFGLHGLHEMQAKQREVAALQALKGRIDDFSVASDSLLLFAPDASLWAAFQAEAALLQAALQGLDAMHPSAARAAHHIDLVLEALIAAGVEAPPAPEQAAAVGPLHLPLRAQIILNQVAGHGVALDTVLDDLLRRRQRELERQEWRLSLAFAATALGFGVLCLLGFGLLYQRLRGPLRALAATVAAVQAGQWGHRAPVHGQDEFAKLARLFNALLDQQQQTQQQVSAQQARLRQRERWLAQSQRIARIGSWRLCLADQRLEWSAVTYQLCGVAAQTFEPNLPAFRALVHPDDRVRLSAAHARVLQADWDGTFDLEVRVCRPDGAECWMHLRAEGERDAAGRPAWLTGTIQDLSERHRTEQYLSQYQQLVEASGDLFAVADDQYRYTLVNQAYCDLFGRTRADLEGVPLDRIIEPEYFHNEVRPRLARALAGEPQSFETERWHPTLGLRRLLVRYRPLPAAAGQVPHVAAALTDLTELKQAQAAVREQTRLLELAGRMARVGGWSVDLAPGSVTWSDVVAEIHDRPHGYQPALEEGIRYYVPEHQERIRALFGACAERGEPYDAELQIISASGERRWVRTVGEPVPAADGQIVQVQGAFQDIDRQKAAELEIAALASRLRRSRDQLAAALHTRQALIDALPAHIALLDADGNLVHVNDQWRDFALTNDYQGWDLGLGRNYLEVCAAAHGPARDDAQAVLAGLRAVLGGEQDRFCYEYPCHSPQQQRWFRLMVNPLSADPQQGGTRGVVVMHLDITERKLAEQELNRLAYEDPVTGLYTRNGFVAAFQRHLFGAGWPAGGMVVILDIEGQRNINDAHGYEVGDALLTEIGRRLRERVGAGGLVGRLGGDEFVVFLPAPSRPQSVPSGAGDGQGERPPQPGTAPEERCRWLAGIFAVPFQIGSLLIESAARFGYTRLGARERAVEALLHEAELALFEARNQGRPAFAAYTAEIEQALRRKLEVTRALRRALDEGQFLLHFQPQVDLATGHLLASEALLRWQHPQQGLQAPAQFIGIAEQSQLIGPIGLWVMREACRRLRAWLDAGLPPVRLAINCSVVQFRLGGFVDEVREALAASGIDPGMLTLEITESVFAQQSQTLRRQMQALHQLGVRLSLDDFGTGYSSLLYLQQYPFDEIKIDRGFVLRLLDDPYSHKIVTTVVGIAAALGADAVAEGVESAAVAEALLGMGCRIGQGYWFSRPLAANAFEWLLAQGAALPLADPGQLPSPAGDRHRVGGGAAD